MGVKYRLIEASLLEAALDAVSDLSGRLTAGETRKLKGLIDFIQRQSDAVDVPSAEELAAVETQEASPMSAIESTLPTVQPSAAMRADLLPDPILTPQALKFIEAEEAWLREQDVEHFTLLHFDAAGDVCGATRLSDGDQYRCEVPFREVARDVAQYQSCAVLALHNHPNGNGHPSDLDESLTRSLKEMLHPRFVRVLGHHIVPVTQETRRATESAAPSDWQARQAWLDRQPTWFREASKQWGGGA